MIKEKISQFFHDKIKIIDASSVVAQAVKNQLSQDNLLNTGKKGSAVFYVSDYTESFLAGAKIFFKEAIQLNLYPLWE